MDQKVDTAIEETTVAVADTEASADIVEETSAYEVMLLQSIDMY
ncbi:hypothetical protein QLQ12_40270 [Actinoplanes sp. NEAU-A12]|uniref:Uncharacterized protein n=1 Tax=Actinoplanes sandaracinus TaxID=3045177 RepID=A0ABT6WZ04_9ACTN|nr:hypothetical protein [Actinoplanes sandaracinus]MDI6104841.1 hypothetical protein [Actinoplanes sandaracinus]